MSAAATVIEVPPPEITDERSTEHLSLQQSEEPPPEGPQTSQIEAEKGQEQEEPNVSMMKIPSSNPKSLSKVSSMRSLSRLPSDISTTTTGSAVVNPITMISWAETLKSPTLASFSPAIPNSHHGGALLSAVERAKLLSKAHKRGLQWMVELSHQYDQYATILLKADASLLSTLITSGQDNTTGSSADTAVTPTLPHTITTTAAAYSQLAASLRKTVAQPWQTWHQTHVDTCTGLQNRYQASRQAAATARHRALHARVRWNAKRATANTAKLQATYERLVQQENTAVQQCQRIENMGLETMQTVEQDRGAVVTRGLQAACDAWQQCWATSFGSEGDPPVRFRRASMNTTTTATTDGVMDAETLGLPVELGALRDKVRTQYAARAARWQAHAQLVTLVETYAKAAARVAAARQKSHANNPKDDLPLLLGACEGARLLRLWDVVTALMETEATQQQQLAQDLRALRAAHLGTNEDEQRAFKAATEADDASWKQVCEAARAQSRAEMRYRQSTAESAKARERLDSQGGGEAVSSSLSSSHGHKVGQHFGKGLAKMLELMPGENAMKILPTGARASFAQRSVEEADQREAKGRQHLDAAMEVASLAVEAYQTNAESLLAKFDEEEAAGWERLRKASQAFVQLIQDNRQVLLDTLLSKQSTIQQLRDEVLSDVNEWRIKAQQDLVSKCVEKDDGSGAPDSGYQLEVHLEASSTPEASPYGAEDGTSTSVLDASVNSSFDDDEVLDETEHDEAEDEDAAGDASENAEETHMQKLFRRTLSAPSNLRGIRKLARGRRRLGSDHEDFETDLFLTYFWPEIVDAKKVTTIVDSFSCSFRDGGQKLPFQYGRVYLTPNRIIFTSWTKKKLNLFWPDVTQVKPSRGFHGLANDTIHVICRKPESNEVSCMTLGGFYDRPAVLEIIESLRDQSKLKAEQQAAAEAVTETTPSIAEKAISGELSTDDKSREIPIPPDETLGKTTIVVSKSLHNISVQRFYEIVWVEKDKPLFEPWLAQSAFDIEVGKWKEEKTIGPWCKEEYPMTREARFKVKRTTHLYIGPPIANVVQTHRVRLEGNDRCVASMTICFEGIPYSDSFAVEVRIVASRQGSDIKYECGLAVDFRKSTFLKRQIQAGTIEESTPVYKNFYRIVKEACIEAQGGEVDQTEVEEAEEAEIAVEAPTAGFPTSIGDLRQNPLILGAICFLFLSIVLRRLFASKTAPDSFPDGANVQFEMDLIVGRMDKLEDQIARLQATMDQMILLLQERD